jgi:hypothetical protein
MKYTLRRNTTQRNGPSRPAIYGTLFPIFGHLRSLCRVLYGTIILVYFYVRDFLYHSYTIPVYAKAHCTNSEAWVVTDFSITVVQIKKTNKKRSCIRLCVLPGRVQLPKKYPGFFGGYHSSSVLSWKYDFGSIFKITCPCLKEILLCVQLHKK